MSDGAANLGKRIFGARSDRDFFYHGSTEWAALLRKLERGCPDYRT